MLLGACGGRVRGEGVEEEDEEEDEDEDGDGRMNGSSIPDEISLPLPASDLEFATLFAAEDDIVLVAEVEGEVEPLSTPSISTKSYPAGSSNIAIAA